MVSLSVYACVCANASGMGINACNSEVGKSMSLFHCRSKPTELSETTSRDLLLVLTMKTNDGKMHYILQKGSF